jgi:membrane protease YdiL (CAAX protease family)
MAQTRPLAAAAAAMVATAALATASALIEEPATDSSRLALSGSLTSIAFIALALMGSLLIAAPLRETLALVRPRAGGASPAQLVAGQLGFGVLVSAAVAASGFVEGSSLERIDRAMADATGEGIALLAVGVSLLPGISEELLFRGLLLGVLLVRLGAGWAIAISTLPFALLHLDLAHTLGAGLLGLYLAGVRIATGSTLVCIFCHVAQNSAAIALARMSWPGWAEVLALAVAILLSALALREMRRAWPGRSVAGNGGAG